MPKPPWASAPPREGLRGDHRADHRGGLRARLGATFPLRPQRAQVGVMLGGLVALLAVWAGIAYHLDCRERAILAEAHRDVRSLSIVLEQQVERLLGGVDQVMRFIQEDHAADPAAFRVETWMRRTASLGPLVSQVTVFDAQGDLVAARSPFASTGRHDARGRPYFRALADEAVRPEDDLYVDRTTRGRVSGRYALRVARRLAGPDGRFAGVLVFSIDPDYLTRLFGALDVGRSGTIALFGADGYVRARYPAVEGMYEHEAAAALGRDIFARFRANTVGSEQLASLFDGVQRIFGYRAVEGLPLIVTVGRLVAEVLAPFEEERRRVVGVGLAASLALVAALALLLVEFERRRRREARLRETEAALREKTALLEVTLETMDQGLILVDADGVVQVSNRRAGALLRLPDDLLAGRPTYRSLRDHARRAGTWGLVADDAPNWVLDDEHRSRDVRCERRTREGRVLEVRTRPTRDDGVVQTFADITHLKEAEERLRASEARYRLLAAHTADMIVRVDAEGVRRYVSPASRELLGYAPEELVDTRPLEIVHPDDQAALRPILEEVRAGRLAIASTQQRYRRRDGREVWTEVKVRLVRDERTGAPDGWVAAVRDITDRKAAEVALAASEARYRLLADNASDLIVLGHHDGRRTYISPAVTRMLGHTVAEAHAVGMRDWVHPEDLRAVFEATRSLSAERPTGAVVYRLRRRDGRYIWAEAAFRRTVEPATGEVTIVTAIRDVSERQARAEELRLAKEAAERARARAEEEGRVKADFLAAMSHEIRTPLNAVIGFTDLILARDDLASDLRRQVGLVEDAAAALLTIVNDVLDFSKIEAGRVELSAEPFAPAALVEGVLAILRPQAHAKGLGLAAELDAALPARLVGDADRLRQVLLNLVGNALKFTRRGEVAVRVAALPAGTGTEVETGPKTGPETGADTGAAPPAESAVGAARLRVSVADTGIGIPREGLHRLFEQFSQVDGSIRREFGGTGLGLAICKRLVALMGGEIGVDSEEGRGSTFWFTLALPAAPALEAPARVAARDAPTRARLLLAEDLPINQELARLVLERAGYALDVVADGAAAVEAVRAGAYDLVLMDVQMPGMDGIAATEAIRRLEGPARGVPILAMSANVLPGQVARFRQAGMDGHVGKPFKVDDLVAAIEGALREAGAGMPDRGTARAGG